MAVEVGELGLDGGEGVVKLLEVFRGRLPGLLVLYFLLSLEQLLSNETRLSPVGSSCQPLRRANRDGAFHGDRRAARTDGGLRDRGHGKALL